MKLKNWLEDLRDQKIKSEEPTSLELISAHEIIKQLKEINEQLKEIREKGLGVYVIKPD